MRDSCLYPMVRPTPATNPLPFPVASEMILPSLVACFVTFCGKNCQLFFTGEACRVTFFGVPVPPKPDEGVPVVVGKAYDFVLRLLPKMETFPRSRRFTIGERLSAQGLDVLVILTERRIRAQRMNSLNTS